MLKNKNKKIAKKKKIEERITNKLLPSVAGIALHMIFATPDNSMFIEDKDILEIRIEDIVEVKDGLLTGLSGEELEWVFKKAEWANITEEGQMTIGDDRGGYKWLQVDVEEYKDTSNISLQLPGSKWYKILPLSMQF